MNDFVTHWRNESSTLNTDELAKNIVYTLTLPDTNLVTNIKQFADFHIHRKGIMSEKITIEYAITDSIRQINPCVINDKLIFRIIVFLADDPNNCLIIPDSDYNRYVYKTFDRPDSKIYISRQKLGTHLCIDGNVYIYSNSNENISTLDISIYADEMNMLKPSQPNIYNASQLNTITMRVNTNLNFRYYNEVFYKKSNNHKFVNDIIENEIHDSTLFEILKGNVLHDNTNDNILSIEEDINKNRFINKFVLKNIFSRSTCNWIIDIFKHNFTKTSTVVLKLDDQRSLRDFVLFPLMHDLLPWVSRSYGLAEKKQTINVLDMSIIRETDSAITNMHKQDKKVTFYINVMLSRENEANSKFFTFKDKSLYELNQGDAILFYSKGKEDVYFYNEPIYILSIGFEITSTPGTNKAFL